jgi:acetylornithine deacetylase/succinyl-diaminopimelate desuccinylase-like protein
MGMSTHSTSGTDQTVELLQQLIRNQCVNDGAEASGHETRTADVIEGFLEGSGLSIERYESAPGRGSLVARLEGSDPKAPTVLLLGHTDVVPVTPDRWRHDPFGGELIDGEVWGRGAVDMLNLTASMAVATKRLASEGFAPRGTLVYLAVADEEALGSYGTDWLLQNHPDAVRADYVITEAGGYQLPLPSRSGPKVPMLVGEKGSFWCTVRVFGVAGHASTPLRTDNALVRAAEVVRRLAEYQPGTVIPQSWRNFVQALDPPDDLRAALLDPQGIEAFCEREEDISLAREVHACTHTTIAPTVMHAGVKTNVIPDAVDLELDIRTLPGQTGDDVRAMLRDALGAELYESIEIVATADEEATESPVDTPLWDSLCRVTGGLAPGVTPVPMITTGATDARFFRRRGIAAYGAGLFSDRISFEEFGAMFHGDNERIDVESLRLSTDFWYRLAHDFLP